MQNAGPEYCQGRRLTGRVTSRVSKRDSVQTVVPFWHCYWERRLAPCPRDLRRSCLCGSARGDVGEIASETWIESHGPADGARFSKSVAKIKKSCCLAFKVILMKALVNTLDSTQPILVRYIVPEELIGFEGGTCFREVNTNPRGTQRAEVVGRVTVLAVTRAVSDGVQAASELTFKCPISKSSNIGSQQRTWRAAVSLRCAERRVSRARVGRELSVRADVPARIPGSTEAARRLEQQIQHSGGSEVEQSSPGASTLSEGCGTGPLPW
ncbi:hypothetical protein NDU88_009447 [Pleurodeles waltl]|uniref:Uncharacterized protein n=1 Tax=Pleurodeles waltl TaxID=8319 RepID=A0AAV7QRJ5_PLEWA|nr:hypothetical protein NDU88_009447 [Pleurodeles waltl]